MDDPGGCTMPRQVPFSAAKLGQATPRATLRQGRPSEEIRQRQRQAHEMRLAGASYTDIARALNFSSAKSAWRAIRAYVRNTEADPERVLRFLDLERAHRALMGLWGKVCQGDHRASGEYRRWLGWLRTALRSTNAPAKRRRRLRLTGPTCKESLGELDAWLKEQRSAATREHRCSLCGQAVTGAAAGEDVE